jgi:hypothetical protein
VIPFATGATREQVLRWAFTQPPAWQVVDVIAQDEFTSDLAPTDGGPRFVALDCT